MDNITHAALGLAVAEAGFHGKIGAAGVALALVASELPDIDVFFGIGDPWSMITTHRGITHSILLAPVAAAALAGIWSLFSPGHFWTYLLLAGICLFGHIGLDVLTTYGTQVLEPLSSRRFGLGWVAVVDPFVTVTLLAGLVAAWWLRNQSPAAPRFAQVALLVVCAYFALGAFLHHRAMRTIASRTATLGAPVAADATPQIGTVFLWRLLCRGQDTFWLARYNALTGRVTGEQTLPAAIDPSLEPLLATPRAAAFRTFAGQLVRPHVDPANENALILEDMRFSFPTDSPVGLWALRIEFDRDGHGPAEPQAFQFLQRRLRLAGSGPIEQRISPLSGID